MEEDSKHIKVLQIHLFNGSENRTNQHWNASESETFFLKYMEAMKKN